MDPISITLAFFVGGLLFGCQVNKDEKEDIKKPSNNNNNRSNNQQSNNNQQRKPQQQSNRNKCPNCGCNLSNNNSNDSYD